MTTITWDQYKDWVSQLAKNRTLYYCRGHANEKWKLQTSFHRLLSLHSGITLVDYLDVIIPELHYHICAQINEILNLSVPEEFGAFLALLQHHGFPTPLLDWTFSPFIAAYFAFREVNDSDPQSDNVKIFIFDYLKWSHRFQQPLNLRETMSYVSIIRPFAKYNPRLMPQQGAFTVSNVENMEEYILKRSEEVKESFLFTAFLSVKEKPHVMSELNMMGINEMNLFPSIEGICRAMKARFFSPSEVGMTPSEWLSLLRTESPGETQKI